MIKNIFNIFSIKFILLYLFIFYEHFYAIGQNAEFCKQLENSFYNKTNIINTGNYTHDVLSWLKSNQFFEFINNQNPRFKISIPLKYSTLEFNKSSNNNFSELIDIHESEFYNLGFCNYISSQLVDSAIFKDWSECSALKERGLEVFLYDTVLDIFKLHIGYKYKSGEDRIEINKPYFENIIYDSMPNGELLLKKGSILRSSPSYGGFDIICKRVSLKKPCIITITSKDESFGKFIYVSAVSKSLDSYEDSSYGEIFIQQSNLLLSNCRINYKRKAPFIFQTQQQLYQSIQDKSNWTPEQFDCFLESNYLYLKGNMIRIIWGIKNDTDKYVRSSLPTWEGKLKNVESEYLKMKYSIKYEWRPKYPRRIFSY